MVLGLSRWVLALSLFFAVSVGAQPGFAADVPASISLSEHGADRIDLSARLEYLPDAEIPMTVDEVLMSEKAWLPVPGESANFGFADRAFWFRVSLHNASNAPLDRHLELPRPFLDDVRLFHFASGQLVKSYLLGDDLPFAQREVLHQNFVMPLSLKPGRNVLLMRIASSGTIEAPLRLWQPTAFFEAAASELLVDGAVFGVLLVMLIYNLFVLLSTRDLNYLYYIGFVASYLTFWGTMRGLAFAYVWPQAVRWNNSAVPVSIGAACLFAALFTDSFLKLKRHSQFTHRLMLSMSGLGLLLLVGAAWTPYAWAIRFGAALVLVLGVATLYLGYSRWWQGAQFARFFCVSWTAALIGACTLAAGKFGLLPAGFWVENSLQIGILLLVVLLSFTLADRINADRGLRIKAQQLALEQSKKARASQAALLKATEESNRDLEVRVQARTDELHHAMGQLRMANEELQRLSVTDGLTQVGNRASFDHSLLNEHKRAARLQQPLALMLVDLDHFKAINDTHGHPAGDACLRSLAGYMRTKIQRAGDVLARYGGEEFVVLLINTSLTDALSLAEEIRAGIANLSVAVDGTALQFTASIGVASTVPSQLDTPSQMLGDADKALYEAKHSGRNCVRAAAPRPRVTG
jgi:diguanylate cyclase (GGDEF)-like protein